MVRRAERIVPRRYEAELPQGSFIGQNTFGPHSTIQGNQLRECLNWDLYPGYMKSRRGSERIGNSVDGLFPGKNILNGVAWAFDDKEFVIVQVENSSYSEFWSCEIIDGGGVTNFSGPLGTLETSGF